MIRSLALIALALTLAACGRQTGAPPSPGAAPLPPFAAAPGAPMIIPASCLEPQAYAPAAAINAGSLNGLAWEPFRRPEVGWDAYVPVVAKEIGAVCPPQTPAFAASLAAWQRSRGLPGDGLFNGVAFNVIKGLWQERRPFVMATLGGQCPGAPDPAGLAWATLDEGFGQKPIQLRPGALDAYRRMAAAARAELPEAAADPQLLTIFSGFRSPDADEARCAAEGNCQGVVRARCSAHRTGLAIDLALNPAPGYRVDNAGDENRLFMSRTAAYRWLVANAGRFGFVNYVFEPWHWEWTGEPLLPMSPGTVWPPKALTTVTPGPSVEQIDDKTIAGTKRSSVDPDGVRPRRAAGPAAKSQAGRDTGRDPDAAKRDLR